MAKITAFPLCWPEGWPRTRDWKQINSRPFRNVTFTKAVYGLIDEVGLLQKKRIEYRGTDIIISTNLAVRGDGLPYATQRKIGDPGVAIYFVHENQQVAMARDAYTHIADNIRSLALAVEHLRGLERHGGATMVKKAFSGFLALPAPESCWTILGTGENASIDKIKSAYRKLSIVHHPDKGGDIDAWNKISKAYEEAKGN